MSQPTIDHLDTALTAGSLVPAGEYRRVDVPGGRVVLVEREDHLPASCDGHVALYVAVIRFANLRARLTDALAS